MGDRLRLAAYMAGWGRRSDLIGQALRSSGQPAALSRATATSPVFIIGAPRSGTSALGWALDAHPDFSCNHESEVVIQQYGFGRLQSAYLRAASRKDAWIAQHGISLATYAKHLGVGISSLYAAKAGNARWVDTTPRHALFASELALLFPNARFVVILRNGVEVVDSLMHSNFSFWGARSFWLATWTWRSYVKAALAFAQECPQRCHILRHEHLVDDEPTTWQTLFQFLGAQSDPACQDFLRQNVINSRYAREPGDLRSAEAGRPREWSRYQRTAFNTIAGSLMQTLEYDSV